MKKRIIKIIAASFAVTVLAATGYATLVLYPHPLFDYDTSFGQVGVLSEQPLSPEFSAVIEDAIAIISESELYDPDAPMGVILADDHIYHKISPGKVLAYSIGPYAILAGKTDPIGNLLSWDKSPVRMNLVKAIAHELTHCMQGRHYGYFKVNRSMFPWKLEGYAEYIAHGRDRSNKEYSLYESVERLLSSEKIKPVQGWMTTDDGFDYPIDYYRFRLMTEYLFDVEGISYDEYVNEVEFHDVYKRMIAWHKTNAESGS